MTLLRLSVSSGVVSNVKFVAVFVALLAVGAACSGPRKESLIESLREYNDGVRWGRTDWSIDYLPKEKQAPLLNRWATLSDLRITGYIFTSLQMEGSERAVATVQINWYSQSQMRVHSSVVQQVWVWVKGEKWQLKDQRWVSGAPFPLLDSPPAS
ncbi:MAG: hypothetical protein V1754_04390 [Pseudomonadota bacterium]